MGRDEPRAEHQFSLSSAFFFFFLSFFFRICRRPSKQISQVRILWGFLVVVRFHGNFPALVSGGHQRLSNGDADTTRAQRSAAYWKRDNWHITNQNQIKKLSPACLQRTCSALLHDKPTKAYDSLLTQLAYCTNIRKFAYYGWMVEPREAPHSLICEKAVAAQHITGYRSFTQLGRPGPKYQQRCSQAGGFQSSSPS